MKCPNCGKELWEYKKHHVMFRNKEKKGEKYQVPLTVYWCANEYGDEGCGFEKLSLDE